MGRGEGGVWVGLIAMQCHTKIVECLDEYSAMCFVLATYVPSHQQCDNKVDVDGTFMMASMFSDDGLWNMLPTYRHPPKERCMEKVNVDCTLHTTYVDCMPHCIGHINIPDIDNVVDIQLLYDVCDHIYRLVVIKKELHHPMTLQLYDHCPDTEMFFPFKEVDGVTDYNILENCMCIETTNNNKLVSDDGGLTWYHMCTSHSEELEP